MDITRRLDQTGPSRTHFLDYYYQLRKHKWLILSALFLTVLLTGIFTFTMKPVYRAKATLVIEEEAKSSPLTGERMDFESGNAQQLTFQTHFKMISSRPVLERALEKINFQAETSLIGPVAGYLDQLKANVKLLIKRVLGNFYTPEEKTEEQGLMSQAELERDRKVKLFATRLKTAEVRGTRLLDIEVEDNDPRRSRDMANVLAETYIIYASEVKLESSRKMMAWLNAQLYEMRQKVEEAERAFQDFKERENVFSLEGKQRISVQKIEEMNASYLKARSERLEVEAKIQQLAKYVEKGSGEAVKSVPTFLQDKILETLFSDLVTAEVEYGRLRGVYKSKHPEMVKLTSKIQGLRDKIRQQIQKALDNVKAEQTVLLARERALQEAISRYEAEAIKTNRKELEYAILDREVETNRELYNTILTKIKETNIVGQITSTNLRLVSPASTPTAPIRPKKAFNIILSILSGLFLGIGLALLLEYLDQTVHSRDEVVRNFELPVLTEIPILRHRLVRRSSNHSYASPSLLEEPMNSHFAESYRVLNSGLGFTQLNRDRGSYVITSSSPGEGKSTVAFNLALTMAMHGKKTLLVEADLRLPPSRQVPDLADKPGVADILLDTFSTPVVEGKLKDLTVGDLHKLLEVQERTGILHYWNDSQRFSVSFLKGRIVEVDWSTRPPEERLGTLLVRSGFITEEQSEIALKKQKVTSGRLGQALIHLGFITAEQLAGPLKLQMQENLGTLYLLEGASYRFEEMAPESLTPRPDTKEADLRRAIGNITEGEKIRSPFLMEKVRETLLRVNEEQMWILTAGKKVTNPGALLTSDRMQALLALLREEFDMVVLDTPPVATISDSAVLARLSDGLVFVIRAGVTQLGEVRRATSQLETTQTPILGVVINALDVKMDSYYYGRHYHKYTDYYTKVDKGPKRKGRKKAVKIAPEAVAAEDGKAAEAGPKTG